MNSEQGLPGHVSWACSLVVVVVVNITKTQPIEAEQEYISFVVFIYNVVNVSYDDYVNALVN